MALVRYFGGLWMTNEELQGHTYMLNIRLRPSGRYSRVELIWEDLEWFLVHPIVINLL